MSSREALLHTCTLVLVEHDLCMHASLKVYVHIYYDGYITRMFARKCTLMVAAFFLVPQEKAVSTEVQWIVDHLDDPSVFQKSSHRGFETFKCDNYRFRASDGQRIAEGEVVPVMGVGRINLGKVDFQKCIEYLEKPESKMEFDSATNKGKTVMLMGCGRMIMQKIKRVIANPMQIANGGGRAPVSAKPAFSSCELHTSRVVQECP